MASEQLLSLSENDFEVIQSGVDSTHRSIDPPLSDSFVIPPMLLSTTTLTDEKSIKNDESTITNDQQETGLLNSPILSIASSNSSDAMTSMLRSQLDTISLMEKQLQEFSIIQEASASLQSKVEDLSSRNERLEKDLEETRARVLFLEDEKNDFIKKKQTNDDLEKKIEELSSKLVEYEEGSQSIQQLQHKAAQAEKREEELKKRMLDLTTHLKEESRRMNEERKRTIERDQERFEALTATLEELEQQLSVQQVQQQEKENIPEQPEELQHNEDARTEVEVEASLDNGQNDGKTIQVAKDAKKADEPEKSVDESCQEVVEILKGNPNNEQWHHAMKIIHHMFSKGEEIPIDKMINCGLVPFLVQGLRIDDEEIQLHCATAIIKIVKCRREEKRKVVESGTVAPLIALITSTNYELAEMATRAVIWIAVESAELRDVVIQSKGVEALTTMCDKLEDLPVSFVREIAEAFFMICFRSYSQVSLEVLDVIVQCLFRLLQFEDNEVCKSVISALDTITYEPGKEFPQKMLVRNSGILPFVFKHLKDDDDDLVGSALWVLYNMTKSGNESLIQSVLDLGTLSVLPEIMEKKAKNSRIINDCWDLIVNLTAGSKAHQQSVLNNGLLKMINKVMSTGNSEIQFQCTWALYNLVKDCTEAHILSLMAEKPMAALNAVLMHTNDECVDYALRVIHKLFSTANPNQLNTIKKEAEEAGVLENLEKLKKHSDEEVRSLANKIFSEYFAKKYGKEANENLKEKEDEGETKMVQKREMVSDDANSDGVKKGKSDEKKKD